MRSRPVSAHAALHWPAVAAPLWCQFMCMQPPVLCLLTAPEGLVTACCFCHRRQYLEECVQASEIADRLGLFPPIMDQCEYNLLKRDRVGHHILCSASVQARQALPAALL